MKNKKIKLLIGVSLLISIASFGIIYGINTKIIHTIVVGYRVHVESDYAYVSHNDGIEIINIEDKDRPYVVGNVDTSEVAFGIDKDGDLLYTGSETNGLVIANVSDPRTPIIYSETSYNGAPFNLAFQDSLVFLLLTSNTVEIVNVSNPRAPYHVATYASPQAYDYRDLVVSGEILFIADAGRGVEIVNISQPTNPILLNTILTSAPIAIFKHENLLFLGCHGVGVKWYDVSNLDSPVLKGAYQELYGEAYGVWGNTTHLYVADLQRGTYCLNITEGSPVSKMYSYSEAAPHDITGGENYVYLADQDFRLKIFDSHLTCLYNGHKRGYGIPIGLTIVTLGIAMYAIVKTKREAISVKG
ncbi:MAG: hypothetical protein E4G98_02990 [Promethearchaeota archaeon]|nr:MAG: hypothetical protein E4G98_02990 [Candidatus Lokiarchaeota archaeon]